MLLLSFSSRTQNQLVDVKCIKESSGVYKIFVHNNSNDSIVLCKNVNDGLFDIVIEQKRKYTNIVLYSLKDQDTIFRYPRLDFYQPFSGSALVLPHKSESIDVKLEHFFEWSKYEQSNKKEKLKLRITIYYLINYHYESKVFELDVWE